MNLASEQSPADAAPTGQPCRDAKIAATETHILLVVPSVSVETRLPDPILRAYEERFLCVLLTLADPGKRVVYVTSQPVDPVLVGSWLNLLPDEARGDAAARLALIALGTGGREPLANALLARDDILACIETQLAGAQAELFTWTVTSAEVRLAERLGLARPDGIDPGAPAGKSHMRRLLADLGVPIARGVAVRDRDGLLAGLRELLDSPKPPGAAVLKLEAGLAGMGNAVLDLAGAALHGPAFLEEVVTGMRLESKWETQHSFLEALSRSGAVLETLIEGPSRSSPSVQFHIGGDGVPVLRSIHSQLLAGPNRQTFVGVELPAPLEDARAALAPAMTIARALAALGARGDVAIDFVAIGSRRLRRIFAVDVNLRRGGATAPFMTLERLCPGRFDPRRLVYVTDTGETRAYVSIDAMEDVGLIGTSPGQLLARLRRDGLAFDRRTGRGVLLSMAGSVQALGRYGLMAVSTDLEDARDLTERARAGLSTQTEPS